MRRKIKQTLAQLLSLSYFNHMFGNENVQEFHKGI